KINKSGQFVGTLNISVNKSDQLSGQITMFWITVSVLLALFVALLICLFRSLKKAGWNIKEAIGESQPKLLTDLQGNPMKDAQGNLLYENVVLASSSRLIAIIGLFVIAISDLLILIVATWVLVTTGKAPELGGMSAFVLAQAGIFTPYFANQLKQGLAGSK